MEPDRDHLGRKLSTLRLCALFYRTIVLSCRRCGRTRYLDAVTLWWLFEQKLWDDELKGLPERFWCLACGTEPKSRPIVHISEAGPAGKQFPYPDEREWKRLKSRFRS